jgi:adenosylcobinamide-GDP ribazoletransferase
MKKEWKIFLTAVMFLTRIRVPKNIDHSPEYLQRSPKYFPVIGWIAGGLCSLVFLVFNKLISTDIAILALMIGGILITGAFHEDGFADVCDGFGGGWTKEKILLIMKDSRIGAFGAIGLVAILSAKFLLLKELFQFIPGTTHPSLNIFITYHYFIIALVTANSLSRLMPVFVIQLFNYVTDPDTSKSKPLASRKLSVTELIIATLFALLPFIFLSWHFLLVIIPVLFATFALANYFKKWIGGYTGDCLGAIQQVSEIVFYLGFIIICKYIL